MWYKDRKKGRTRFRYSIGEKIRYYSMQAQSRDPKKRRKARKNLERMQSYQRTSSSFGKVFIVKDGLFDAEAPRNKPRRVVCVSSSNNEMKVIPIRKNKKVITLCNFDGMRSININSIQSVPLREVYEKQSFNRTNNDYLTKEEKKQLLRKVRK